ncbi:MAG: arsenate reductase ArsC [Myxococcales bacterium]|nr:arsenate reductase ArsC [Myxococcales bacterium]
MKVSVLFLCVANSARSQMAEALARHLYGDRLMVESAGSRPSRVNPWAIAVMAELGLDLSSHHSKDVDSLNGRRFDLVITLCEDEVCPVFLNAVRRLHWPLEDPDRRDETRSPDARLEAFRQTRDELARRLRALDLSSDQ